MPTNIVVSLDGCDVRVVTVEVLATTHPTVAAAMGIVPGGA